VKDTEEPPAGPAEIVISGPLDRRTGEVLRLEILRLARRHGVELGRFRFERAPEDT
jgi:hypothetical protein